MQRALTTAALAAVALSLTGCMGSQTGKALNAFDSKTHWDSDYSESYKSHSFWYSGYSDEQIEKAESGKKGDE